MFPICLSMLESEEERIKMSEIYEKYKPLMLRYALKLIQNEAAAEDAVHDAFLALIKHKKKYFSFSCTDLRIPIVIITRSKCIDRLRKANLITPENIDGMEHLLKSGDISIEEQIMLSEEYEALVNHVSKLDEMSRLILEMRYILGMSHKEIAEELNINASHINKKITRAKAKIRKLSAKEGGPIG